MHVYFTPLSTRGVSELRLYLVVSLRRRSGGDCTDGLSKRQHYRTLCGGTGTRVRFSNASLHLKVPGIPLTLCSTQLLCVWMCKHTPSLLTLPSVPCVLQKAKVAAAKVDFLQKKIAHARQRRDEEIERARQERERAEENRRREEEANQQKLREMRDARSAPPPSANPMEVSDWRNAGPSESSTGMRSSNTYMPPARRAAMGDAPLPSRLGDASVPRAEATAPPAAGGGGGSFMSRLQARKAEGGGEAPPMAAPTVPAVGGSWHDRMRAREAGSGTTPPASAAPASSAPGGWRTRA